MGLFASLQLYFLGTVPQVSFFPKVTILNNLYINILLLLTIVIL